MSRGRLGIKIVLFDTSALMLMALERVRVFEQLNDIIGSPYVAVVTKATLDEIERLRRWGDRVRVRAAARMLQNIIVSKFSIANIEGEADESIIKFAKTYSPIVVTADINLKRELERLGIKVIYYRGSQHRLEGSG